MAYWTYPKVLSFMKKRTIVSVTDVRMGDNKIGYILETTSGLSTDKTLCLIEYRPSFVNVCSFKKMLREYDSVNKCCIISTDIKSWGPGKVKKTNTLIESWISDYFSENQEDNRFIETLEETNSRIEEEDISKESLMNEIKNLHKVLGEKITLLLSLVDMG